MAGYNPGTYQYIKQKEAEGALFLDMFTYNAKVPSLGVGASVTVNVQVQADTSFIWDKTSVFAAIAGAAQTNATQVLPQIDVTIQDTGSGRLLQNEPVQVTDIAGDGKLPFVLPQPRVFSANSTITLTFTNTSNAEVYTNLQFSLIGRKVFRF